MQVRVQAAKPLLVTWSRATYYTVQGYLQYESRTPSLLRVGFCVLLLIIFFGLYSWPFYTVSDPADNQRYKRNSMLCFSIWLEAEINHRAQQGHTGLTCDTLAIGRSRLVE